MDFLKARVSAKIWGTSVVTVTGIVGFVWLAQTPLELWLKFIGLIILGTPILSGAYRLLRGGEQGPIDLEITDGQRRLAIGNIPLGIAQLVLTRGFSVYTRQPLPRPSGIVKGNPAKRENLIEQARAGLPEQAEITEEALPVPDDAVSIPMSEPNSSQTERPPNAKPTRKITLEDDDEGKRD